MAKVDSLSIELTANTKQAEDNIQRVIDMLRMLNAAAIDASKEAKVVRTIRNIAKAANEINPESAKGLRELAKAMKDLGKVGDLSGLKNAGKNLASVIKAVNGLGATSGNGFDNLANGIKNVSDSLDSIKNADTSKLREIQDALSGETSGPLYTSSRQNESAELGGGRSTYNTGGDMQSYGAMTVYTYVASSIRDAAAAYHDFVAALGGGVPPIFTEFADQVRTARDEVLRLASAVSGLLGGGAGFGGFIGGATQAGEAMRMLTGDVGGGNGGPWIADDIRDATSAFNDMGNAAMGAAQVIETEFVNLSDASEAAAVRFIRLRGVLASIGGYIANDIKTVFSNIGGAIKGFASSVLRIARYRIIRAMLKNISQGFTEGRENLYKWSAAVNGHYAKSMNNLATSTLYMKNALGTLVGPLMEALAPALQWIIDRLVDAINYFNMFVAAISGKSTYTAAVKSATTWGKAVSNAAGNAKDKVDELKRTIMGFDEINKLDKISEGSGGTGGTGGSGGGGVAGMFEERELTGGFQEFSNALESALQDSLSRITLTIGAAELALGAILALSGANVGLGLGLMASGALAIGSAIVANWDGIPNELKLQIATIEAALASTLVLGAILAFSGGHIGLGIGLMAAALSAGFGAVTIAWNSIGDTLGEKIRAISVLVGGAAFGIGNVLTFAGHPEIGIPMMIAGAGVAAISINWNYLEEKLKGPIGAVVALVSGASIVLGILAILGSNVPLGIGLILAGTAGLVSTVAANWDGLVKLGSDAIGKVKEGWETIKELAVTAWVALKKKVGEWADAVWNFLEKGAETIVKTVSVVAGKIADFAGDAWNMVKAGSQTIAKTITAAFEAIGEWTSNAWLAIQKGKETVAKTITAAFEAIGTWTSNAWLAVQKGAETIAKKVTAAFEAIGEWTSNAWLAVQKGAETIAKKVTAAFEAIGEWTSNAWLAIQKGKETVAKTITAAFSAIGEWTSNAWLAVQKGAETVAKTVTAGMTVLNTWSSSIVDFILGPEGSSKRTSIALSIVEEARQIINFLRDPVTGIKNIVIKISSDIESGLAAFLGINPSSDRENIDEEDASYTANIIANATVNANPGAGFSVGKNSSSWNLDQNIDGTVTLAPTPPATVAQTFKNAWNKLSAENKTVQVIGNLVQKVGQTFGSVFGTTMDVIGKLVPIKGFSLGGVFGTALTILGSLTKKDKDQTPGVVFDTSKVLNFFSTLAREKGAERPSEVWNAGASVGDYVSTLAREKGAERPSEVWNAGASVGDYVSTLAREKGAERPSEVWNAGASIGDYVSTLARKKDAKSPAKVWNAGATLEYDATLNKGWEGSWKKALGIPDDPKLKIQAQFKTGSNDTVKISGGGGQWKLETKELGGIFANGIWRSIPQYAAGTLRAGSIFAAGERGPELVGHIGGRTEVLNKSQLAATMYSAVNAAMSGVTLDANFGGGSVDSYETMYEAVYDAVTAAMSKSDDRDREKIALLRQLNQKEFSANISTGQINQAQRYANRRAGTTIVPVGT